MWGLREGAASPSAPTSPWSHAAPQPPNQHQQVGKSFLLPCHSHLDPGAALPPHLGVCTAQGRAVLCASLIHYWDSSQNPSHGFTTSILWGCLGLWSLTPPQHPPKPRVAQAEQTWLRVKNCTSCTSSPMGTRGHQSGFQVVCNQLPCSFHQAGAGARDRGNSSPCCSPTPECSHPGSSRAVCNPEVLQPQNSLRAFIFPHTSNKLVKGGEGGGNQTALRGNSPKFKQENDFARSLGTGASSSSSQVQVKGWIGHF